MLSWLIAGLAAGGAGGSLVTWALMRRRPMRAGPADTAVGSEGAQAEPSTASAADDEVRQVLAANQRAVADLEGRFRDRKQAAGAEESPAPPRPRKPKAS